jgi:hypothetical protein
MSLVKPSFSSSCSWFGVVIAWWLLAGAGSVVATPASHPSPGPVAEALSAADHALLEEMERTGFQFFVEQTHPVTGLVRDRARADGSASQGKASIASSGFALPAWVIAVERGWIGRAEAVRQVRLMLEFLATRAPRQRGFFYHFMEMDSGARAWKCELSSIDSAILFAGRLSRASILPSPPSPPWSTVCWPRWTGTGFAITATSCHWAGTTRRDFRAIAGPGIPSMCS